MPEPSFSTLRTRHSDFLRRLNAEPVTPALVAEAQTFVEAVRRAGRTVDDDDDREYLRSLLTFWGNWLYNHTRAYPDTNLEPFIGEKRKPVATVAATPSGLPPKTEPSTSKDKTDGQGGGGRMMTFTCLGLVAILVMMLVVIGLLAPVFGQALTAAPTDDPALEKTVEAIDATLSAPTSTPFLVTPTLSVGDKPTSEAGVEPTPTFPSGVGGGGFGEPIAPISLISAQILEPAVGSFFKPGEAMSIGVAFTNMQPGWEMFYGLILRTIGPVEVYILPDVYPIDVNPSGVWLLPYSAPPSGSYDVMLFVATTHESADLFFKYSQAGANMPYELLFTEGIIRLGPLTYFNVE